MPYWSSNKVGAVDAPRKPKKKKGITMEDLKAQTAARLAQEQKQRRSYFGWPSAFSRNETAPPAEPDAYYNSTQPVGTPTLVVNPHLPEPPQPLSSGDAVHPSSSTVQTVTSFSSVSSTASSLEAGKITEEVRDTAPLDSEPNSSSSTGTNSRGRFRRGGNRKNKGNNAQVTPTQKLPHGLTVQELKEMTKARLQAEATSGANRNKPPGELSQPAPTHESDSLKSPMGSQLPRPPYSAVRDGLPLERSPARYTHHHEQMSRSRTSSYTPSEDFLSLPEDKPLVTSAPVIPFTTAQNSLQALAFSNASAIARSSSPNRARTASTPIFSKTSEEFDIPSASEIEETFGDTFLFHSEPIFPPPPSSPLYCDEDVRNRASTWTCSASTPWHDREISDETLAFILNLTDEK